MAESSSSASTSDATSPVQSESASNAPSSPGPAHSPPRRLCAPSSPCAVKPSAGRPVQLSVCGKVPVSDLVLLAPKSMSQVSAAGPGDNVDTDRIEVHQLMQVVITDGFPEGTDEYYYAAIMLTNKRVRNAFTDFRTAEGHAGYLLRMWPFFQSRGGPAFP